MREDFAAAFRTRTRDEWCAELPAADTCTAPVLEIDELTEDAQFRARGVFVDARHPTEGNFRQLAPPLAGMDRGEGPVEVPDWSRTQTEELLAWAGVAADDIETMRADGVIG